MPDSTLPERIYGLTVADGRRNVRPGEEIRLRFRARSMRASAPAVRASIAIPRGWTALDPVEAELEPCDGGEHGIDLRARAETADDGDAGAFQVALSLAEGVLGSNVVRIAVQGRPCFESPESVVHLEAGPDPGTIRAVVTLTNAGDAVARNARVIVPAPPGFRALDAPDAVGDVVPGATREHAVCFRASAPAGDAVTIAGARVCFTGGEATLAPSAPLPLAACVLPPRIAVVRAATRLEVALHIENAGMVPACDVAARIAFPPGWRAVRGAATLDGTPAGAVVRGDELTVCVPFIAAGDTVVLRAFATARAPRDACGVRVSCAGHEIEAPPAPPLRRSLQLDARVADALVTPGASVALRVLAWNDGETDEVLTLHAAEEIAGRLQLRAGRRTTASFALPAPAGDADTTIAVRAVAADGAALGTCALVLRPVVPHAAAPNEAAPQAPPAALTLEWDAPPQVDPGVPFDVRLRCRVAEAAAQLAIRPRIAAARYVAGSTRVNGHTVVDGDAPPLLRAVGLRCYDVPAGGAVALTWSLLADGGGDVSLAAAVDADGDEHACDGPRVTVAAPAAFACRPDGLPFHLDAAVVDTRCAPAPDVPCAAGIVFRVRLDAVRRAELARMLRGLRGSGIAAHLPLVAALFPDTVEGADPVLGDALTLARDGIRATYERLFVKLRIPGYEVGPYDLEDAPLRSAMLALFAAALGASPATGAPPALFVVRTPVDLRDARERLARAPLGGVDAVAAAAQLLPRTGSDPAACALAAYATLVTEELEAARTLGHDAFAAFLGMHANPALDRACAAAVAALA